MAINKYIEWTIPDYKAIIIVARLVCCKCLIPFNAVKAFIIIGNTSYSINSFSLYSIDQVTLKAITE